MHSGIIFLITFIFLSSCSNIEKNTISAIHDSEYDFIKKECQLNELFKDEPEFAKLIKKDFCSSEVGIINYDEISKAEAIIDYKITFTANQKNLKKWLRAYKTMSVRKAPSPSQKQLQSLIREIYDDKRNWVYNKQTVKLSLTEDGWRVDEIIR